ncbi:MAG: exodeoxyribonuclease VII large subunit [Myxococcales bacterium]|nr:exodeoxyribonuclease VII large subunit [Myxococcales bacterium]|tara:strand:+ start:1893 stop:3269 length:1377 start_codon:yes stop_codon:yes gene_type:complete
MVIQSTSTSSPLSVSELTAKIKTSLEEAFDYVVVEGELSGLNAHRSGHVYLTIKDENARIDGIVWRSTVQRLRYKPQSGEHILVKGRLNVYAPQGSYKLIIDSIEPVGLGRLQAQFEALKAKLDSEGLFDTMRKRPIPLLPRAVGLVTSATGAARRDVESVIQRRSPQIPIVICPASVQGDRAVDEIVRAIRTLNGHAAVDVIIVGRGGGSLEDLWAFNDEKVARAIATSSRPVISAVGHETDTTIADFVSDCRAPTPSAAAELAVPVRDDLLYSLDVLMESIHRLLTHQVKTNRSGLIALSYRLRSSVHPQRLRLPIQRQTQRLNQACSRRLSQSKRRIRDLENRLIRLEPRVRLSQSRNRLNTVLNRLDRVIDSIIKTANQQLNNSAVKLSALSPLANLNRGFSITRKDDQLINNASQLKVSDTIRILFANGMIDAHVTEIHSDNKSTLTEFKESK